MSPKIPFLKIVKKARKAKKPEKAPPGPPKVPGISRLGVYGHSSSGKTCFFSMLYETAREDPVVRLTTLNDETAQELHKNMRMLKGLERTVEKGRWREVSGERRFPDPSSEENELSFEATLGGRGSLRFSSLDYPGSTISIGEATKESISQYFSDCDCLLFFVEPEVLASEVLREEYLASFTNLIQKLSDGRRHISIPVGVVVSKADLIEGFESEGQSLLIGPGYEYTKVKSFESFLRGVLHQPNMVKRPKWAGRVRDILRKLKTFLEPLMARTLDWQIFFCSATGPVPKEEGGAPPSVLRPIGIKAPLYWAASRLIQKRRIRGLRRLTRWVAFLTLLWIFLFSLPYLIHFRLVLPRPQAVETRILDSYGVDRASVFRFGSARSVPTDELKEIGKAYESYVNSRTVRAFFKGFQKPASALERLYSEGASRDEAEDRVRKIISYFQARYDTLSAEQSSLDESSPEYTSQLDQLEGQVGAVRDSLVDFRNSASVPRDCEPVVQELEGKLSKLIDLIKSEVGATKVKPMEDEFRQFTEKYADKKSDYNFLLMELPQELEDYREQIRSGKAGASLEQAATIKKIVSRIDRYLKKAKRWENRLMSFRVKGVPPGSGYFLRISGVPGALFDGSDYKIRLPVREADASIEVWRRGVDRPVDSFPLGEGYKILELDGVWQETAAGPRVMIDVLENFKKDLPKLE